MISRQGGVSSTAPARCRFVCYGCGTAVESGGEPPFRCPGVRPGDDVDHVLRPIYGPTSLPSPETVRRTFSAREPNPFLRYRGLLYSLQPDEHCGQSDGDAAELVRGLDQAIAEVDGTGFRVTPFVAADRLAAELGLPADGLWVKDETGNVAGSHKARHLMGVMLWLEGRRRREGVTSPPRLAIASCGNAALAAAVVAKAAGYPLAVFVPRDADPTVIERLQQLEVELVTCPRRPREAGDPCVHRFREAVTAGTLPFTCQGNENGLVIDGGQTLMWEMLSELMTTGRTLERLFVQVGGGALASSCVRALLEAQELGILARLPTIFAVQTSGCSPLHRAWRRLAEGMAERHLDAEAAGLADLPLAAELQALPPATIEAELHEAARHRSRFMWPWETEPKSVATGILDDETYDWLAVVEGILRTGGAPLVVDDDTLRRANELAREATGIPVSHTGSAGLAGLLASLEEEGRTTSGRTAVLFTGVARTA